MGPHIHLSRWQPEAASGAGQGALGFVQSGFELGRHAVR